MINTFFSNGNTIYKLKTVNIKQHSFTVPNFFIKKNIIF